MAATFDRGWPFRHVISGVHFLWRQLKTVDHASWNNSMTTQHLSMGKIGGNDQPSRAMIEMKREIPAPNHRRLLLGGD
jgi:hypothetical protein